MNYESKIILEEYRKAFKRYYKDNELIDLDKGVAIKFDWVLVRLGEIISEFGMSAPPFRHSKYTIIYVIKGEGEKTIGDFSVSLRDRTLMIVPAHTLTATSYAENVEGYHLSFNLKFFLQEHFPSHHLSRLNLFNHKVTPFAYPGPREGKRISQIFEAILEERDHQRKNKHELIALKILELIILCERQFKLEIELPKNNNHPLMVQYIELIQQHYKRHHNTSFYAQMLHLHPNSLNAATKRYMGQSAKALIATKLLNEAKYLLQLTPLSVKETAYDLGFQSPSSFFRFFKRLNGCAPDEYRRQHLKM